MNICCPAWMTAFSASQDRSEPSKQASEIVVENSRRGRLAGNHIPEGLIHTSGNEVPVREVHHRRASEHFGQCAIAAQSSPEMPHLLIDGQLPDAHVLISSRPS